MTYLATPYTHPDRAIMQARFEQACRLTAVLIAVGHVVFSPIVHCHSIATICKLPGNINYWQFYDRAMLSKAAKLVVAKMDGWETSAGIAYEIKLAAELNIPVEYMEI